MAMEIERFRELSLAHALGALDGEEARQFEAALEAADEQRLILFADAVQTAERLSLAKPPPAPSPAIKSRLMARVSESAAAAHSAWAAAVQKAAAPPAAASAPEPSRLRHVVPAGEKSFWSSILALLGLNNAGFAPAAAFAMLALGLGVLFYAFHLQGALGHREAALAETRQRIVALEDSVARKEALLEVLLSHNIQLVSLKGEELSPTGYGKFMWCPKRRCGILHVSNIPAAPQGKNYQLWLVKDGKPLDAGVFKVNKTTWDGDLFRVSDLAEVDRNRIQGFYITLEEQGGSPAPKGATYLQGTI